MKISDEVYARRVWTGPMPPHAFLSDGCTFWADGNWLECCVEHDASYWFGGTRQERKVADQKLKQCIAEKGHPFIGATMWLGVRIGGVYWLPTSYRWGFGWDFPQTGQPGTSY